MPLQATSGAASYDAFGGGVPVVPNYIEDVFSTYLYTGNGSTQTITNGIDLSGKGGLVWIKDRTTGGTSYENALTDTVRGATNEIQSDTTAAQTTNAARLTSFNSNGFSIGNSVRYNQNADNYVSWTFRKQPKFFDVVTYSGNGSAGGQTINHSLGSAPGCIIVKQTNVAVDWRVYHQTQGISKYASLNTTAAFATDANNPWKTPTSTTFGVGDGTYWTSLNESGGTYVAYLFAHNAGGFGLTGTDNVISCGSFTTDGSGTATVDIGYEPQWILYKATNLGGTDWTLIDNMRGMSLTSAAVLYANSSGAESIQSAVDAKFPTATGFTIKGEYASRPYIYIAIRRGPMKVPTSGTSVFYPNAYSGTGTDTTITSTGFPPDLFFSKARSFSSTFLNVMVDRLRGASQFLVPTNTIAETEGTNVVLSLNMNGVTLGGSSNANNGTVTYAQWNFRRAPSFFDEVCYTGTGSNLTLNHNLGVAPELLIVKARGPTAVGWFVYSSGTTTPNNYYLQLQSTNAQANAGTQVWDNTSTTFLVHSGLGLSYSAYTYVAYLFATCPGVSKVGTYTGTATTKQIDCGFTGGARFVLIKRIDDVGDWYVWDTARGIVSGNDPYLLVNSTAVEVTNTDYVDTYSAGFEISSTAPAAINASGGTFIFLAIA